MGQTILSSALASTPQPTLVLSWHDIDPPSVYTRLKRWGGGGGREVNSLFLRLTHKTCGSLLSAPPPRASSQTLPHPQEPHPPKIPDPRLCVDEEAAATAATTSVVLPMGGPASLSPPPPHPSLRFTQPDRRAGACSLRFATADHVAGGSTKKLVVQRRRSTPPPVCAVLNQDGIRARPGRPRLPSSAVTYSAGISTDLPLHEPPWASFDEYLEDRPRVFRAMFPDHRRSQRLNDEEWRIRMLPIQFLLLSAYPVIDMRLRSRSSPSQTSFSRVAEGAGRVLELQATRWELQGLDSAHMPPLFELDVQGVLYADRSRGRGRSRLKGDLKMSISLVLPAVFVLIPDEVLRSVAESVLKRLVERMKQEVDVSLLHDYREFSKEMLKEKQKKQVGRQPTAVVPVNENLS